MASTVPAEIQAQRQRDFEEMMTRRRDPANLAKEQAAREARVRERDEPWRSIVADPARLHGEDAPSLRTVVAWQRLTPDVALTVTDKAARAALTAAGVELARDLAANAAAIRDAEGKFHTERLLRLVRGEPPVAIPALLDITGLMDLEAVARWLVFHEGGYTLTVGRWVTLEERDAQGAVVETSRVLQRTIGLGGLEAACERWATWRRFAAQAVTHPSEADRLQAAGFAVLRSDPQYRELVDEQRGQWSFVPADEAAGSEERSKEQDPRTVATPGPRPLTDAKLDERIERRTRHFWNEHQRGPATREELSNTGRWGARDARVLERIKVMLAEGVLVETERGLKVDE